MADDTIVFKITGGVVVPEIEIAVLGTTILDLKKRIESVLNLKVERQTLKYRGQELNNDRSIASYKFNKEKKRAIEVVLLFKPWQGKSKLFNVSVRCYCGEWTGWKVCTVKVGERMWVGELMSKIYKQLFWYACDMTFYHHSVEIDDDDYDIPLSAYYVFEGSTIEGKRTSDSE